MQPLRPLIFVLALLCLPLSAHAGHPHCNVALQQQQLGYGYTYAYVVQSQRVEPIITEPQKKEAQRGIDWAVELMLGAGEARNRLILGEAQQRAQLQQALTAPPAAPQQQPQAAPAGDVQAIFAARCASCHAGANAKGELSLFAAGGALVEFTRLEKRAISCLVQDGLMPPGAPLTAAEKAAVEAWSKSP